MHRGEELANILAPFAGVWGYIYGTSGEIWTKSRQDALPNDADHELARKYGGKWIGLHVADCSGLVKYGCTKLGITVPHGSNSQWKKSLSQKSEIGTGYIPPAGALVFKCRGNDFYHVGVSLGDGWVVEAQGTIAGVVRSSIRSGWTHYGLIAGLDYAAQPSPADEAPGSSVSAVVVGGALNVREKTSKISGKVAQLPNGTRVQVLDTSGDWCRIRFESEGYVLAKYLEVKM